MKLQKQYVSPLEELRARGNIHVTACVNFIEELHQPPPSDKQSNELLLHLEEIEQDITHERLISPQNEQKFTGHHPLLHITKRAAKMCERDGLTQKTVIPIQQLRLAYLRQPHNEILVDRFRCNLVIVLLDTVREAELLATRSRNETVPSKQVVY